VQNHTSGRFFTYNFSDGKEYDYRACHSFNADHVACRFSAPRDIVAMRYPPLNNNRNGKTHARHYAMFGRIN